MSRIAIPALNDSPATAQPILDGVNKLLGFVPNLHRLMALSPAALSAWFGLQTPLSKTLDVKTRDAIALAVSEANECDYCLSAHSYIAENFAKMPPDEIALNRQGKSDDPKRAAAAHFAKRVIETKGKVRDGELAAIRDAGFADAQIVEIVALSSQFLMTNFMNNVADTDIDFPAVAPAKVA